MKTDRTTQVHFKKPKTLFPLGRVVATPGIAETLGDVEILRALARHQRGDWGEVCDEDREANDRSVKTGSRMLSVYVAENGGRFWVITEGDRSATTLLWPNEY